MCRGIADLDTRVSRVVCGASPYGQGWTVCYAKDPAGYAARQNGASTVDGCLGMKHECFHATKGQRACGHLGQKLSGGQASAWDVLRPREQGIYSQSSSGVSTKHAEI